MIKKFIDKYDGRKIFYHFNFFGVKFRLAVKTDRAFKIKPSNENYKKRTYLIPNRIYYTKMGYSYDGKNLYTLMKNSEVKTGAK
jgi:hypothetical protein